MPIRTLLIDSIYNHAYIKMYESDVDPNKNTIVKPAKENVSSSEKSSKWDKEKRKNGS